MCEDEWTRGGDGVHINLGGGMKTNIALIKGTTQRFTFQGHK